MTCSSTHWKVNKSAERDTQTLRAGCKAEPKIFAPPQTLPGGVGRPKFNQLEMVTTFSEDRCTQFRVIVVTDPHTHIQTHTQTGLITIHCAAKLSLTSAMTTGQISKGAFCPGGILSGGIMSWIPRCRVHVATTRLSHSRDKRVVGLTTFLPVWSFITIHSCVPCHSTGDS